MDWTEITAIAAGIGVALWGLSCLVRALRPTDAEVTLRRLRMDWRAVARLLHQYDPDPQNTYADVVAGLIAAHKSEKTSVAQYREGCEYWHELWGTESDRADCEKARADKAEREWTWYFNACRLVENELETAGLEGQIEDAPYHGQIAEIIRQRNEARERAQKMHRRAQEAEALREQINAKLKRWMGEDTWAALAGYGDPLKALDWAFTRDRVAKKDLARCQQERDEVRAEVERLKTRYGKGIAIQLASEYMAGDTEPDAPVENTATDLPSPAPADGDAAMIEGLAKVLEPRTAAFIRKYRMTPLAIDDLVLVLSDTALAYVEANHPVLRVLSYEGSAVIDSQRPGVERWYAAMGPDNRIHARARASTRDEACAQALKEETLSDG